MVNGEKPLRPPGVWRLEHVRFTAFGQPDKLPNTGEFFEEIFGFPPESEVKKRNEMKVEFSTSAGGVNHVLGVQAGKLDVIINPAPADETPTEVPYLQEGMKCRDFLNRAALKVVDTDSGISRVAVGERWFLPVPSVRDGYAGLGFFLPGVDIDPDGSRDFSYRINRARQWKEQIGINRLSTWNCLSLNVAIHAGGGIPAAAQIASYVSLLTDINTKPEADFGLLDAESKRALVNVLFEYSAELTEKGDVP